MRVWAKHPSSYRASLTQLAETVADLRHWHSEYELDPEEYERVQHRLGHLHDVARKYRVQPSELRPLLNRLTTGELETTSSENERIEKLRCNIHEFETKYDRACYKDH